MNAQQEFEVIQKCWSKLSDKVIYKDVATKGKYINLAINYLSKRNNKSIAEISNCFEHEINEYVIRLLTNSQIFKAEHVLRNCDRKPQYIFYEFLKHANISAEVTQVIELHLLKTYTNYENEKHEMDLLLSIIDELKENQLLCDRYSIDVDKLTLEWFRHKITLEIRQSISVILFFKHKNFAFIQLINKHIIWKYLFDEKMYFTITKWLDLVYLKKFNTDCNGNCKEQKYDVNQQNVIEITDGDEIDNKKNIEFNNKLYEYFSNTTIDEEMLKILYSHSDECNDIVRNSLAKNQIFLNNELTDVKQMLTRIFITESLDFNKSFISSNKNFIDIAKVVFNKNHDFHVKNFIIFLEELFTQNTLLELSKQFTKFKNELDFCISLKNIVNDLQQLDVFQDLIINTSNYLKINDNNFYSNNPLVYLMELFLQNSSIDKISMEQLTKVPLVELLLKKLMCTSTFQNHTDYNTTLQCLIKQYKQIDINKLFNTFNNDNIIYKNNSNGNKNESISFSNLYLSTTYADQTKLNYQNYLQQCRCSYALYIFLMEQLQNYSEISIAPILRSINNVTEMAIVNFNNKELVVHCIAFIEMLNLNTIPLRALLKCMCMIEQKDTQLLQLHNLTDINLIQLTENILIDNLLNQTTINVREFEAIQLICKSFNKSMPINFLKTLAKQSKWFLFIVFATYFNYTTSDIIKICQAISFNDENDDVNGNVDAKIDESNSNIIINNRNIARNIVMALKFDDYHHQQKRQQLLQNNNCQQKQPPQKHKRHSFSFREHKKKMQNKLENVTTATSDTMSSSISSNETVTQMKINPSHFLYANETTDLFATLLLTIQTTATASHPSLISPTSTPLPTKPSSSVSAPTIPTKQMSQIFTVQLQNSLDDIDFIKFKYLTDNFNSPLFNQNYINYNNNGDDDADCANNNNNKNNNNNNNNNNNYYNNISFDPLNTEIMSSSFQLLKLSLQRQWPLLAVLSGELKKNNIVYCWLTWLLTSIDEYINITNNDNIKQLSDLTKIIIERCVTGGYCKTLNQSIKIFYPNNVFQLFTEYLSRTLLLDFSMDTTDLLQKYLLAISNHHHHQHHHPHHHHHHRRNTSDPNNISNINELSFLNIQMSELLNFSTDILIVHLKYNFHSLQHQQLLLQSLCDSGISDFNNFIDFCTIKSIWKLLSFTKIKLNIDLFTKRNKYTDIEMHNEYQSMCEQLIHLKQFQIAMDISDLLHFSKDNIIYENWWYEYSLLTNEYDLTKCELDCYKYNLSPELVVNFYIHVADKLDYSNIRKYEILKCILGVIKKHHLFPNESFDRDRIEYEMILSFIKNSNYNLSTLDIYHSEYYECIMLNERCVLYKTFLELKEMSGVEELSIQNRQQLNDIELQKLDSIINCLLDSGDIVQALRIQAVYNYRPLDLHFLVFAMALAEGLASIYDLTNEQRQMLNDNFYKYSKYNKRTLQHQTVLKNQQQSSTTTSPIKHSTLNDSSDNNSGDFEEIPSREKQDILDAIQSLASRLKHGIKLGQRIAMAHRTAVYLDKEYIDVLKTKDPNILLQNAIGDDCFNKLVVMRDIMISMEMTSNEIAKFLGEQIASAIIKSRFYLLRNPGMSSSLSQLASGSAITSLLTSMPSSMMGLTSNVPSVNLSQQNTLWGYNLDTEFHIFLELCASSASQLGNWLLKYVDGLKIYRKCNNKNSTGVNNDGNSDNSVGGGGGVDRVSFNSNNNQDIMMMSMDSTMKEILLNLKEIMQNQILSHKKQNTIIVELLIKAHECFVHECSMEGIANILQRTKILNSILANAKSWNLIVRMLMGIGRYRDMYYCFETLIKNDQFESLLGQFENEHTIGLQQAIISYLQENCPENNENYRLAALHFRMYKEIAEMWENEAKSMIAKLISENEIRSNDEQYHNLFPQAISLASSTFTTATTSTSTAAIECIPYLKCTDEIFKILENIMNGYSHAAENYLLDNKLSLAQRAAYNAELIALQINLLIRNLERNLATCICVINIRSANVFRYFINNELSVSHALILSRNYTYEIIWTETIMNQYIILGNDQYLCDFCDIMDLTDDMIETIVKNFQHNLKVTNRMERNLSNLVERIQSTILRYKMASILGLKGILAGLINDHSLHYLKDTNYGKIEI